MSNPEHKRGEVSSSFQRLTDIYKTMSPKEENDSYARLMKLKNDSTVIGMSLKRNWFASDPGASTLNEYEVSSIAPKANDYKKISFVIRENNALRAICIPFSVLKIGNTEVPLMDGLDSGGIHIKQDNMPAAISAGAYLTDWLCKMVKTGKYIDIKLPLLG